MSVWVTVISSFDLLLVDVKLIFVQRWTPHREVGLESDLIPPPQDPLNNVILALLF